MSNQKQTQKLRYAVIFSETGLISDVFIFDEEEMAIKYAKRQIEEDFGKYAADEFDGYFSYDGSEWTIAEESMPIEEVK